jgi:hypothetical protein
MVAHVELAEITEPLGRGQSSPRPTANPPTNFPQDTTWPHRRALATSPYNSICLRHHPPHICSQSLHPNSAQNQWEQARLWLPVTPRLENYAVRNRLWLLHPHPDQLCGISRKAYPYFRRVNFPAANFDQWETIGEKEPASVICPFFPIIDGSKCGSLKTSYMIRQSVCFPVMQCPLMLYPLPLFLSQPPCLSPSLLVPWDHTSQHSPCVSFALVLCSVPNIPSKNSLESLANRALSR